MPMQNVMLRLRGLWLPSNPARNATVIGNSDKEQGPKLVSSPPKKTSARVSAPGLVRPWFNNCSLLRAKSDKASNKAEMG